MILYTEPNVLLKCIIQITELEKGITTFKPI